MSPIIKSTSKVLLNFTILGATAAASAFLSTLIQEMTLKVVETTLESFAKNESAQEPPTATVTKIA